MAMRRVSLQTAKDDLQSLIDAALSGEDVVIEPKNRAAVRLVPVPPAHFKIGIMTGKLGTPPDFLEPMAAADLAAWEGGI